jgi:hypothetical protein
MSSKCKLEVLDDQRETQLFSFCPLCAIYGDTQAVASKVQDPNFFSKKGEGFCCWNNFKISKASTVDFSPFTQNMKTSTDVHRSRKHLLGFFLVIIKIEQEKKRCQYTTLPLFRLPAC